MSMVSIVLTAVAGLAILFFGRQLFWLFVGIIGFIVGMELAPELLPTLPEWIVLLISLGIGLIGALLAMFLQYVAAAIAGFFGGWYLALSLLYWLDVPVSDTVAWVIMLVVGALTAVLVLLLFDYALIILSAFFGAGVLVNLADLTPTLQLLSFIVLALIGIGVQTAVLYRSEQPPRRRPRRRTAQ